MFLSCQVQEKYIPASLLSEKVYFCGRKAIGFWESASGIRSGCGKGKAVPAGTALCYSNF